MLDTPAVHSAATLDPLLRQAIEAEWLALGRAAPFARAGLTAARTAALAAVADGATLPPWFAGMADPLPPPTGVLRAVWSAIGRGQTLHDEDRFVVRALWPLLAPTEAIMETGGDARLLLDPQTRLNGYGASHRPRPWAITFASTTASSVSERGYAAADATRRATTAAMLRLGQGTAPVAGLLTRLRARLHRVCGVPAGGTVLLAASGTDAELLALALAHLGDPARPVSSILIAPEETGSGVPLAACGRHFAIDTAGGQAVMRQATIAGFRPDTGLVPVRLRDADGAVRPVETVAAEVAAAVADAVAAGRRPLLHALDLSKSGLLAPAFSVLQDLRARFGGSFDLVVDACQMRLSTASIRDYLALDATVLVTGSKFLTGPPFSGALLLPPAVARRLDRGRLPAGLEAYCGQAEFPAGCAAAAALPATGNYGLALRWVAALAELGAVQAVSPARRAQVIATFAATVRDAAAADPRLRVIETALPSRGPHEQAWERRQTIFGIAVRAPFADRCLDVAEARCVYRWLNADLAPVLPWAPPALASRPCHIGQPLALPQPGGVGGSMGVLRLACGARLLAGEPSHRGLGPAERLAREMTDVRTVFDKLRLILDHWGPLAEADPKPLFRPWSV